MHYRAINLENVVHEANQSIGRSLTHAACDEGSRTGMSKGISIGLPTVQREQRHLNAKTNDEAGHSNSKEGRANEGNNSLSQVRHVQGTGQSVQITNAQEVQGSTNGAD